jgi:hypothetical protein
MAKVGRYGVGGFAVEWNMTWTGDQRKGLEQELNTCLWGDDANRSTIVEIW